MFDTETCGNPQLPIAVEIMNGSDKTITRTGFSLEGFREGHSEPVYRALRNQTDAIIDSGQVSRTCLRVPDLDYGKPRSFLTDYPPENMDWRVSDVTLRFQVE